MLDLLDIAGLALWWIKTSAIDCLQWCNVEEINKPCWLSVSSLRPTKNKPSNKEKDLIGAFFRYCSKKRFSLCIRINIWLFDIDK